MLFLDTETHTKIGPKYEHHRMKIAHTYYVSMQRKDPWNNGDWKFWDKTYEMNKYMEGLVNEKECLYIFGHNLFFDLQSSDFFHFFNIFGWEVEFIHDKGLTYILIIRNGKRTIKAISTTNYFAASLDRLGKALELDKMAIDFQNVSKERLKEYNRQDVRIIVRAIKEYIDFIQTNDLGKFCLTRSSQAFQAFRHRFMTVPCRSKRDNFFIVLKIKVIAFGPARVNYV